MGYRLAEDPRRDSMDVEALKNPPPPVNFVEWDGLVKLCFNRKNKTLRSLFTSKKVIADLETSWKTFAALRGTVGETPDVKAMVEEVVGGERFDGKRPAKKARSSKRQ